jgi:16S rRNA (guanine966-N2)-methyltransferase
MGLEALSREAAHATFVDQNPTLLKHIASYAETLEARPPMSVTIAADLSRRPERAAAVLSSRCETEGTFSLIFVDPPYADIAYVANLLAALREREVFGVGATIVIEHAHGAPPPQLEGLATVNHYRYGDTGVALLEAAPPETS